MRQFKTGIILAAGASTRFFPFGDKNLFNFAGKPLLLYQIEKLWPYFERMFIVAKSNDDLNFIKNIVSSYKNITVVPQKGEGQAAALLSLTDTLSGQVVVINNCDIFNEKVIFEKLTQLKKNHRLILTAKEMNDYFPGGYLQLSGERLLKLIEKPKPEERPSNLVRLVVDYFADFEEFLKVIKKLSDLRQDGAYEGALNSYLTKVDSAYVKYDDYWYFLKYPWHVLSVKDFFLRNLKGHRDDDVKIHPTAIIQGEVYLANEVIVHEYAKIVGPCYIGPKTVVGNYALIRESMIGANSIIGGYSEVTRSYLGDRVYLHRNYIGDSVFENDILCGAEMLCANFRFDEEPVAVNVKDTKINSGMTKLGALVGSCVKIGVNTSIMPGVKIAPYTVVMPHSFINQDLK